MIHLLFTAQLFSDTSLDQVDQFAQFAKSIEKNLIMQNKPNLYCFYAVSGDYEEKQTQTNPIQTQNKAIFTPKNRPPNPNKPNSNPNKPNLSLRRQGSSLRSIFVLRPSLFVLRPSLFVLRPSALIPSEARIPRY